MSTVNPKYLDIERNGVTYHIPVGGNAVIDDTAGEGDTDKAWSANKLVTELAKKIGGNKRVWYGTATSVDDKNLLSVSVSNFDSLQTGDVFHISNMLDCYPDRDHHLFIFINNINPGIQVRTVTGEVIPQGERLFAAGSSATFIYNGTYLLLVNGTHASTTTYGTTKLENSSSSSSTTTALVPAALKSVVDNRITPLETSVAGKADKDTDAVEGNFAAFDANGNPVDSGHKHSDYITDISGKADKVSGATSGNFAGLDANGNLTDSGKKASDFLETGAIDDTAGTGDTDKVWSADKLANENTLTKTLDTPAAIQTFSDGAAWPMEMEIAIEPVQSGTGDPSPSNVRAISGWDSANIITDGKNLIKNLKYQYNTYTIRLGADDNSHHYFLIPGTYTLSANNSDAAYLYYHEVNDSASTRFSELSTNSTGSFTVAKAGWYRFHLYSSNAISASNVTQFQLEFGETATTYEPYKGNTYNITFPSTCYGGTLTVHADGTGTLVVDWKNVDLGNLNWGYTASDQRFWADNHGADDPCSLTDSIHYESSEVANIICTNYKTVARANIANYCIAMNYGGSSLPYNYLHIKDPNYSDATTFKTAMTGVQVVYKLATPITYTLSVPQVLSILGLNNVWADCGNINKISYVRRQDIGFIREDTKGQIRAATNPIREELGDAEAALAIVIDGDSAPKNIASGQYLFVKNHSTLATGAYHATASIAKDASVTSNNTSPDADGITNALNTKFPSSYNQPTNINGIVISAGGYVMVGKLCVICMRFYTTQTEDNKEVAQFPAPVTGDVNYCFMANNKNVEMVVLTTGKLRIPNIGYNSTAMVMGCYLTA